MEITESKKEYYQDLITCIGYSKHSEDIYKKKYSSCEITVDFSSEKIHYPDSITKGDETTSNFANSENFVVLECVDRLLEKGYAPQNIELEKKWALGRQTKGKLDILVKKEGFAFLMVECKTWGSEYDKAVKGTQQTPQKSQLLSYYHQDQKADYICYYTSHFENGAIVYKSSIIETKDYSSLSNLEETAQRWNKQYKNNGIFEADMLPYKYEPKSITELKDIQPEDSGIIFNQFAEILRHHVVSDKSNAFNKIFNLFLCKLVDEEKHGWGEEYLFQVKETDTDETLLLRLNDLYKDGMKDFLNKEITDFQEDQYNGWDEDTKKAFNKLRLHKNNEFAFVEVYNEESFTENSKIVREVVELLQPYRLKYSNKHQVLGDFFELLLNTGLKQESGQFFTPIPITRFMLLSLGMEEIVTKKIQNGENHFLPYVIDFAMGSGHFLTEAMDVIDIILKKYSLDGLRNNIVTEIKKAKDYPFGWANEYIYGIEKDYRLVKTAKISCFLHGDGLANILHGDGLAPYDDKNYKGKLQFKSPKINHNFDVLVANPPYSVQAFKAVMNQGADNFDLYQGLTDSSSEIEALFIERMNHLLKEGGIAGIILPVSILTNTGIYEKARAIILQKFEILGITALDSKTFMATGTNTIILFLRKRKEIIIRQAEKEVKEYLENHPATEGIQSYLSFRGLSEETDREKLLTYLLTYKNKTIVSKTGDKEEAVKFRGYDFSNRRGNEGIEIFKESKLYDEDNWDNPDKLAALYRKHFRGEDITIPNSLKNNAFLCNTHTLLNWDSSNWGSLRISKRKKIVSKYDLIPIEKITSVEVGKSANIDIPNYLEIGDIDIVSKGYNISKKQKLTVKGAITVPKNTLLISTVRPTRGAITITKEEIHVSNAFCRLKLANKYLFYILNSSFFFEYLGSIATGVSYPICKDTDILSYLVPYPPIDEQNRIVTLMQGQDDIITESRKGVAELETKIKGIDLSGYPMKALGSICEYIKGTTPKYSSAVTEIQVIKSGQARGYKNINVSNIYYLGTESKKLLQYNDIMINTTGVGTAGRITLFQLTGSYVSDSHISVIRVLTDEVIQIYIYYAILNQYSFEDLEKMSTGSSGQIELGRQTILGLTIPVPSPEEQQKIVAKIESYEKQIEELNNKIAEAKNKQAMIMAEIFTVEDAD